MPARQVCLKVKVVLREGGGWGRVQHQFNCSRLKGH
jgi:hypothetical protein